uniref:Intraflagellar transport protein 20 homolog n=1 Tax=Phallusia mammillata TaxID=59560 RepID=A0A6F9DFN4_9ASCI|nr:intraflagellar transport protein 20 homolog [Phallusia mammillata]
MAEDALSKSGLHFDDLNKLRVLEPESAQQTGELKEECHEFVSKITEFQKIVGSFIDMTNELAGEVEKEKMKAIGYRNLLKSVAKQRDSQQQQLRALIAEKKTEMERLRLQHESLKKQEMEQAEFIEQFSTA